MVKPKRRWLAVLLAVLFGPWTYLYTWQRDRQKFVALLAFSIAIGVLANLVLHALDLLSLLVWLYCVYDTIARSDEFYAQYPELNH